MLLSWQDPLRLSVARHIGVQTDDPCTICLEPE